VKKKEREKKKGSYMYIYRVLRSLCNLGWDPKEEKKKITEG
jgi:hypothetical protein